MSIKDEQKTGQNSESLPPYLKEWRGLWTRKGNEIVEALPEDIAVAKSYPTTHEKSEVVGGTRLTILTKKKQYQIGEEVRVIHVLEVVEPGHEVFIMGPKPVYGEYVDDRPVTLELPSLADYDGVVLESPNVDYNYNITSYSFFEPGRHRIHWQMGELRSNTLELEIMTSGVVDLTPVSRIP
jgi:hypothetical protein